MTKASPAITSAPSVTRENPLPEGSTRPAIILLAHGARDSRWAEPFLRVIDRVREMAPDMAVELAYLEHLPPSLGEAARTLAGNGAKAIRVVPLFFGRGGHLRVEVPRLVGEAAALLPAVTIELALPAGEDDSVIDALAAFCVRAAADPTGAP